MKLRLRFSGQTKVVHVEEDQNCQNFKTVIREQFPSLNDGREFLLSLNGSDTIETSGHTTLARLSIVHGDLVHILLQQPVEEVQQPIPSSSLTNTDTKRTKLDNDNSKSTSDPIPDLPPVSIPPVRRPKSGYRVPEPSCLEPCDPETGPSMAKNTTKAEASSTEPESMECVCDEDDDEAIQDGEVNKYLNEPMLICDSTAMAVPQTLQSVYEEAGVTTENEAICVLLHVLMSEGGFSSGTQGTGTERDNVLYPLMPSGWKAQKTYRLTYQHETCPGVTFSLICVPMGKILIVHGTTTGANLGQKCQFQFEPSAYVSTIDTSAAKTFKNLSKLSRLFKDRLAHSMLDLCRQDLDHTITTGLLGLMEELKVQILSHLDIQSLCRVSQVGHEFHRLAMQPKLWRRLYMRNFGRRTNNNLSQDWYKLYKEKHILRKQMRERMHQARCVMPPRFIPPPFAGPEDPFPFHNPGFIGGDYDRYPAIPGMPGIPGAPAGLGPTLPRPRFDPFGPLPHQRFPPPPGAPRDNRRGGGGLGGGGGGFFFI